MGFSLSPTSEGKEMLFSSKSGKEETKDVVPVSCAYDLVYGVSSKALYGRAPETRLASSLLSLIDLARRC